jgi:hypothetical protein
MNRRLVVELEGGTRRERGGILKTWQHGSLVSFLIS